jgi:hypothetical protein
MYPKNRIELIQAIFQQTDLQYYLEIGCRKGRSFLPIRAKHKMVVDPAFAIPFYRKWKWGIKVPENANNQYFEETSDDFFAKRGSLIKQLDVVLVDGLHTYRASLLDALNSLKYLNKDGIIIFHDCLPPNRAASMATELFPTKKEKRSIPGWTNEWCGDVYKTIIYLRKAMPDALDALVVNTDYGLGILRPKTKIDASQLVINEDLFNEINKIDYDQLMADTKNLINLKDAEHTGVILKEMAGK